MKLWEQAAEYASTNKPTGNVGDDIVNAFTQGARWALNEATDVINEMREEGESDLRGVRSRIQRIGKHENQV